MRNENEKTTKVVVVPEGQRSVYFKDEIGRKKWSVMKLADENRANPTKAESQAKQWLQRQGLKFVFQKVFMVGAKGYIADFFFPSRKVILEIDGGYHQDIEQRKMDLNRTRDLETLGYKVVRMSNAQVYGCEYPQEIFGKKKRKR